MVVLVCQEKNLKWLTAMIFVVSLLKAKLNALFQCTDGNGKFKRMTCFIDQFLLVEEEEKKLLVEKFALKDFNLVGFFTVESFCCSGKKPRLKPKQQSLKRIFRYIQEIYVFIVVSQMFYTFLTSNCKMRRQLLLS